MELISVDIARLKDREESCIEGTITPARIPKFLELMRIVNSFWLIPKSVCKNAEKGVLMVVIWNLEFVPMHEFCYTSKINMMKCPASYSDSIQRLLARLPWLSFSNTSPLGTSASWVQANLPILSPLPALNRSMYRVEGFLIRR